MSKEAYLLRMLEKQDPFKASIAKEAMTETTDRLIEGLVYHGDPSVSPEVSTYLIHIISHSKVT